MSRHKCRLVASERWNPFHVNTNSSNVFPNGGTLANGRLTYPLLLLVLVAAFFVHALWVGHGVVIDDAYIAFRYSKNLANGLGFSFQAGEHVEGFTCFSWVVLGAALHWLGIAPAVALPMLGIACGAATVATIVGLSQRCAPNIHPAAAGLLPGLVCVLLPGLAYYAGSGLETALFALLAAFSLRSSLDNRVAAATLASALAFLTRPEGAVIAALAVGVGLVWGPRSSRRSWWYAVLVLVLVMTAYCLFKWQYFGTVIPNTATAKPASLSSGLLYVGMGMIDTAPLLFLTLVLLLKKKKPRSPAALMFGCGVVLVVVAAIEGGDWMPAGRFLVPGLIVLAPSLAVIVQEIVGATRTRRWLIFSLALLGLSFFSRWSVWDSRMLAGFSNGTAISDPLRDSIVRRMVNAGVRSVGTLDIGRISHTAPQLRILDLGGLIDRDLATMPGDYRSKQLEPQWLEAHAPDAFLLTSRKAPVNQGSGLGPLVSLFYPVERMVEQSAWFRKNYRLQTVLALRHDYYLCWYARRIS